MFIIVTIESNAQRGHRTPTRNRVSIKTPSKKSKGKTVSMNELLSHFTGKSQGQNLDLELVTLYFTPNYTKIIELNNRSGYGYLFVKEPFSDVPHKAIITSYQRHSQYSINISYEATDGSDLNGDMRLCWSLGSQLIWVSTFKGDKFEGMYLRFI